MRIRAAILCFAIALASGAASAQSLVYRVDQATAVLDGGNLLVRVTGAARTGGWTYPRLVIRGISGRKHLELQFVATPPRNSAAVVQSVVPVNVSLKTHAPRNRISAIKVVSETNTVTARIVPKKHAARAMAQVHAERGTTQAASATTRFRPEFLAR